MNSYILYYLHLLVQKISSLAECNRRMSIDMEIFASAFFSVNYFHLLSLFVNNFFNEDSIEFAELSNVEMRGCKKDVHFDMIA